MTPCRPVRPRSRRCEKKSSGSQLVQRPVRSTVSIPAARRPRSIASARSRFAPLHDVVAEARAERLGDLLPHLVAAGADSRPDRGCRRAGHRSDAVLEDAVHEPAPADVQDDEARSPIPAGEDDGEAVRREEAHGTPRLLRPEPVSLLEVGAGRDDTPAVRLEDARPVDLPGHRRGLRVGADGFAQNAPVLDDSARLVVREDAEVQRLEIALAHASLACREGGEVPVAEVRLEELHACSAGVAMSAFAASISDSRPSSSPFTFRRRSSSRIAPTRGDSCRPSSARSSPEISRPTWRKSPK